jgi:hypothetical protein
MSLLDVFQTQRIKPQDQFRSGLFFFHTGQPIFILATTAETEPRPYLLKDASEVFDLIPSQDQVIDKLAHEIVQTFFHAGGESLSVFLIQVPSSPNRVPPTFWGPSYLEKVLGKNTADTESVDRSGFRGVLNFDAPADLIAFPQAAWILDAGDLKHFYNSVLLTIEKIDPWFLIIDPPYLENLKDLSEWIKIFNTEAAAVYFPWVAFEGLSFTPPSPVVCALIQLTDRAHSIADAPSNYKISAPVFPLREISIQEIQKPGVDKRINYFRFLPNKDLALWGCYTLSKEVEKPESQLIHISRTLRSIRDAIVRIAEPFVFEPRIQSTCDKITEKLTHFFRKLESQNILVPTTSDGLSFDVEVGIESKKLKNDEPMIRIDAAISVERATDRLGLQFEI